MTKLMAGLMLAGAMAFSYAGAAEAQDRAMRRVLTGQTAPMQKAMTERQARRACQTEMRGSRESRSALRAKMRFCINEKMQGN